MSIEENRWDMLSLPKRMRDMDRSDGMWKTDKWKTEFQVGKMGKMIMKKFVGENENEEVCRWKWEWKNLKVIYIVKEVGKM